MCLIATGNLLQMFIYRMLQTHRDCNMSDLTSALAEAKVLHCLKATAYGHCLPIMQLCKAGMSSAMVCRSGKDKLLHDLVCVHILPQLVESAAARRRAEEKQAAIEAMPKKRSSRLQVSRPFSQAPSVLTVSYHFCAGVSYQELSPALRFRIGQSDLDSLLAAHNMKSCCSKLRWSAVLVCSIHTKL